MIQPHSVLVIVDVQNDFVPGGALSVPDGHNIIPSVNRLSRRFENVVLTQDWHPAGHISFASSHEGRKPFESIELDYGPQILWPDHCVRSIPAPAGRCRRCASSKRPRRVRAALTGWRNWRG